MAADDVMFGCIRQVAALVGRRAERLASYGGKVCYPCCYLLRYE